MMPATLGTEGLERDPDEIAQDGGWRLGRAAALEVVPRRRAPVGVQSSTGHPALVFPAGYIPGPSAAMARIYEQMRPVLQGCVPVLLARGDGRGQRADRPHAARSRRRVAPGPSLPSTARPSPPSSWRRRCSGSAKGSPPGSSERTGSSSSRRGARSSSTRSARCRSALQAKLLRALQGKEIQPVGGPPVPVDVRVVAATNSDLDLRMQQGQFRRDLYYRVAGSVLRVPPLRERRDDIPGLVRGLLAAVARETGNAVPGITAADTTGARGLRLARQHPGAGARGAPARLALPGRTGHRARHALRAHPPGAGPDAGAPTSTLDLASNVADLERRLIRSRPRAARGASARPPPGCSACRATAWP